MKTDFKIRKDAAGLGIELDIEAWIAENPSKSPGTDIMKAVSTAMDSTPEIEFIDIFWGQEFITTVLLSSKERLFELRGVVKALKTVRGK